MLQEYFGVQKCMKGRRLNNLQFRNLQEYQEKNQNLHLELLLKIWVEKLNKKIKNTRQLVPDAVFIKANNRFQRTFLSPV